MRNEPERIPQLSGVGTDFGHEPVGATAVGAVVLVPGEGGGAEELEGAQLFVGMGLAAADADVEAGREDDGLAEFAEKEGPTVDAEAGLAALIDGADDADGEGQEGLWEAEEVHLRTNAGVVGVVAVLEDERGLEDAGGGVGQAEVPGEGAGEFWGVVKEIDVATTITEDSAIEVV